MCDMCHNVCHADNMMYDMCRVDMMRDMGHVDLMLT